MSMTSSPNRSAVKVFLSYSNHDYEWKEGLKRSLTGLVRNGHICVWDDRLLPAGSGWEDCLGIELQKARIVLLLLTEDYLNSEWCCKELDEAFRLRENDPAKRIIPLFVRRITLAPNDKLLTLQGLPRGMKWADDWGPTEQNKPRSLIADGILEEVYPLVRATPHPRSTRSAPTADLSPKFVDRETQEGEFRDFWDRVSWSRPGSPQIYLLPAEQNDCPDYFLDRLRHGTLERIAINLRGSDRASIPNRINVDEPRYDSLETLQIDCARNLFYSCEARWRMLVPAQLSAQPLARLERFRLNTFVLIRQRLRTDLLGPQLLPFLKWYVDTFWSGFFSQAHFLIFVHLIRPTPLPPEKISKWFFSRALHQKRAVRKGDLPITEQISSFLPNGCANLADGDSGAPVKLLSQLSSIEIDDVIKWMTKLPKVLPNEAYNVAEALYLNARGHGESRLSDLYRPLEEFYLQHTVRG